MLKIDLDQTNFDSKKFHRISLEELEALEAEKFIIALFPNEKLPETLSIDSFYVVTGQMTYYDRSFQSLCPVSEFFGSLLWESSRIPLDSTRVDLYRHENICFYKYIPTNSIAFMLEE